jgi:hypothetical protein
VPQGSHVCVLAQTLFSGQSLVVRHSTQPLVAWLHFGVGGAHCASLVHPSRHFRVTWSHTGFDASQSASDKHAMQLPATQRGSVELQSAFVAQATQVFELGSQMRRSLEQSPLAWQPTHAPFEGSQNGCASEHAAVGHDEWQRWSLGQQAMPLSHSAFVWHSEHAPRMQYGSSLLQSVSERHSTHPSATSHLYPLAHCAAATSALHATPLGAIEAVAPPHAPTTTSARSATIGVRAIERRI